MQSFNQIVTILTSMLKITRVEFSLIDSKPVSKNSIIDKIGDNNKVSRAKIGLKTAKFKSKNTVQHFLFKFKLFPIYFELGFLISETRLAFAELRQTCIKAPILYYFNLKCHIYI